MWTLMWKDSGGYLHFPAIFRKRVFSLLGILDQSFIIVVHIAKMSLTILVILIH